MMEWMNKWMAITCTKIIQSQTRKCLHWCYKHVLLFSKDQSMRNEITQEKAHCQVSSCVPHFMFNNRELKQAMTITAIKMSCQGLRSKTNAVYVHYKCWYNSSNSAKQELEMTKFCIVWGNCELWQLIFHLSIWNWIISIHI